MWLSKNRGRLALVGCVTAIMGAVALGSAMAASQTAPRPTSRERVGEAVLHPFALFGPV
jgi:hypothetical protein